MGFNLLTVTPLFWIDMEMPILNLNGCSSRMLWNIRRKIGLVLKKTFGRFFLKWNKLRKWNRKKSW